MKPIDRSPAPLSSVVSCGAAVVAGVATGLYSWQALGVGVLGMTLVGAGIISGGRGAVTVGCVGLFVAAVVSGIQGAPAGAVLPSVTATVLAWDTGTTAISLGRQLGRDAPTVRLESMHIGASAGVGALTAGTGYLIYEVAAGGRPLSALLLLVVAAVVLLTAVLRDEPAVDDVR